MDFVDIGGTGLRTSRIGLGTWAIGSWMWGGAGDASSIATIRAALDRGITLIDTAPTYGRGHAEEIVGRALAGRRDEAVIATKAGLLWDETGQVWPDATPARLVKQVEDSLRRLRTDRIDIYQLEGTDPQSPIEQTAEALGRLLGAGKIRAIGATDLSPAQMQAFRSVAPLHVVQPLYNLFEREAERDVLPYAARHGLTALTYGALCHGLLSGLLSGPLDESAPVAVDDTCRVRATRSPDAAYVRVVRRLDALARERFGKRVAHLAVRWVLDRPGVGVTLWRARRPDQLNRALEALDFQLDGETLHDVDRIVRGEIRDPSVPTVVAEHSSAAVRPRTTAGQRDREEPTAS
jgi:aryl-alcohol dehydrogenase-like predicted oxidoreductase